MLFSLFEKMKLYELFKLDWSDLIILVALNVMSDVSN